MSTIASYSPLNISETVRDRPVAWFQRTINRIWPAVTFGSRRCGLSNSLLPATTGCPIIVWRCEYNIGPGVRLLSPGLLQLSVLRHLGRTDVPRLQSVQNAAARLVTGTRRSYTPVLRQLHWLPVRQSVDFKVATLVYRSLSGISPSYPTTAVLLPMFASDDYVPQLPNMRCDVDTYCTFRDRGFAVAGPGLYGTVFHRTRERQTCRTIDSGGR